MKTSLLANFKLKTLACIPAKTFCFGLLGASEAPDLAFEQTVAQGSDQNSNKKAL